MSWLNWRPLAAVDHAQDICDHCGEGFRMDVGHWCPAAPPEKRGDVWVERTWHGDRWYRCIESNTRMIVDLRDDFGTSSQRVLVTEDKDGTLAVCMRPTVYLSFRHEMIEKSVSLNNAMTLLSATSIDELRRELGSPGFGGTKFRKTSHIATLRRVPPWPPAKETPKEGNPK